jgi:hypothetical protein
MKTYKLNYKDKHGRILIDQNILANNLKEALYKSQVLLKSLKYKGVKKVDLEK